MNERLATFGGALLALVLLAGLMFGSEPAVREPPLSRPLSQDAGSAGLLGVWRWLETSGVPLRRLQHRYDALADLQLPAQGNLMILVEPMQQRPRRNEWPALQAWVRAGNAVLLLQSQAQTPAWAQQSMAVAADRRFGLRRWWPGDGDDDLPADDAGTESSPCADPAILRGTIAGPLRRLRPLPANKAHPLLAGVREVAVKAPAHDDDAADYAEVEGHRDPLRLYYPLLCDPQLQAPVFSAFRYGAGRVYVSDYSEAFSNDNLDRADNARLLANLVRHALGADGAVVFDDMHQGDSLLYDPKAFFGDPRLHGSLLFLLGIWLIWLLGYSDRFGAPAPLDATVSGRDYVRMLGRYYARHLRPQEAARGLFRHFFNHVRAASALPRNGEPAWEVLARAPRVAPAQLAELRALHAGLQQGRKTDLKRLRNLTLVIEKSLI